MQLLIFIAAIGFFVLRILASSKKKQPETAENGAANRFAENESDEFAFGTGFAQGKPKPAAQNRTEGRAYSASGPYCGTANCTGGSIHEGAHEGEVRAPRSPYGTGGRNMRSNASSGKKTAASQTAKKTAARQPAAAVRPDDDPAYEQKQPVEDTKKVQSGADRLLKAISAQPAVTQGIIWNEILSAPAAARDSD